jgi:starch-binding outer membrane protein SusE/F
MKKISIIFIMALALLAGCKKVDYDTESKGESNGPLRLLTPSNGASLTLNSATPNEVVTITWSASTPGVNAIPTYKWVAALKTGSIDAPILEIPSNNNGKDTKLTLTFSQIDAALSSKGIVASGLADLVWSVVADNGSTKLRSADVYSIKLTRFGNGTSPFIILGPTSSTSSFAINPISTTDNFNFNWTKSKPSTGSPSVTYKVLFAEQKYDANGAPLSINWKAPLFSISSNNAGVDSIATINYKRMSDSLTAYGFTNFSTSNNLKWTVVATSGSWNQQSDYSNDLVILRKLRVYLPGGYQAATGNGSDWTPADAPELIGDDRASLNNKMYYTYIFLPANVEFKITVGRAWDVNYGPATTGASNGSLVAGTGNNFKVTTAGYYRLSFNIVTLKYDIRIGRMGFVGGSTPTNWNPPGVFPTNAMANAGKNLFIGVTTFTNGGGWKLIDNDQWDSGSQLVDETRSYGSTGGDGTTLTVNGSNFNDFATAGRYRVIWDGRDVNNVKYNYSPATEMRVVGDGMNMAGVNDWDPPTSPQMTYTGNGVWTRVVTLKANKEIKFLAGNAWGAFDYEDNSGQNQALGTPKRIQWENGPNFKTPTTAGTYTITLNENTQTVTIN